MQVPATANNRHRSDKRRPTQQRRQSKSGGRRKQRCNRSAASATTTSSRGSVNIGHASRWSCGVSEHLCLQVLKKKGRRKNGSSAALSVRVAAISERRDPVGRTAGRNSWSMARLRESRANRCGTASGADRKKFAFVSRALDEDNVNAMSC